MGWKLAQMTDAALAPQKSDLEKGRAGVAALLLTMGKPLANKVLQYFDEEEVRQIAETTATLGSVPRHAVERLVEEIAVAVQSGADILGSSTEARQLLAGVVPPEKLTEILARLRKADEKPVWERLADAPAPTVAEHLLKEHPQVIAFVLSKSGPGLSAAVLGRAQAGMRSEILRRLLAMRPVTGTASILLEAALREELLAKLTKVSGPPVHARVADIINKMDRQQIEAVLNDLEVRRPKDAKLVKGMLFNFEDIVKLSADDRVKLFDSVPVERTIMALHGADAELREMVLNSLSQRSRRMIEQELSGGFAPPARETEKARRAIAGAVLEMAERGVIVLGPQASEEDLI